jgi:hypothetical protein
MTIPRLNAVMKQWEVVPPKVSLLAGIAGWDSSKAGAKRSGNDGSGKTNEEKVSELLSIFPVLGA